MWIVNGTNDGVARRRFLDERRAICEQRMDTLHAPVYDQRWGSYINPTHRESLLRLVSRLKPPAVVLDAACGTGKYWDTLIQAGLGVVGVDLSRGMLAVAVSKHPEVPTYHSSLQDLPALLRTIEPVDALLCIDAMECVGPEDWPTVVAGLADGLKPGGLAYLTVELADADITMDDGAAQWPLVPGEVIEGGGYHFYPSIDQARNWLTGAGFDVWSEAKGDGYHHFLLAC